MPRAVPFQPTHLGLLDLQESQVYLKPFIENWQLGKTLAAPARSWTVIHDGRVLGCGGVNDYWQGYGRCWAFLSNGVRVSHFLFIHRLVAWYFDEWFKRQTYHRIDATVDLKFKPGHQWMRLLGFKPEGVMAGYNLDKSPAMLYARVADFVETPKGYGNVGD